MRKVELRVMELNKYEVIKKLIDTNGNKKSAMLKTRMFFEKHQPFNC